MDANISNWVTRSALFRKNWTTNGLRAAVGRNQKSWTANLRKFSQIEYEENERDLNRERTRMDANIQLPWTHAHGPSRSVLNAFVSVNFREFPWSVLFCWSRNGTEFHGKFSSEVFLRKLLCEVLLWACWINKLAEKTRYCRIVVQIYTNKKLGFDSWNGRFRNRFFTTKARRTRR